MSHKITPYRLKNSQQEEGSWAEYYPKLQRYCRFLAQNAWDGDDIAQETYLKAQKYNEHQMTSALLNKIAYHYWVDMLRKRKKEMLEADAGLYHHDLPDKLDELKNSVDLVLKHFTPKQAITFVLKEAFQYQLKEIAALLNTSEMAVKASLHRAKKRLGKEENQSSSVEFWDEEEREQLSDLFYEALKNEDPAVLIQSLPMKQSINDTPEFKTNVTSINSHAPSSTLCMAA